MKRLITAAFAILLLAAPFFLPEQAATLAVKMLVAALFALGFNLLWQHARLLSFGHAVYFGAGMFTAIHLMRAAESGAAIPLPLIPFAGAVVAGLTGFVLGFLATIRTGTYFAMITLAIGELVHAIGPRWETLFGGESGMSTMRMPFAGIDFATQIQVYGLTLAWSLVATGALFFFSATPLGRITFALGENETRLRALGFRTHLTKTILFAISAAIAGLAGGLLAVANENGDYEIFAGLISAQPVLQTFIGGAASFLGPALGAVILTWVGSQVSDMTRLWLLYQGILFVVVVLYAPNGIAGLLAHERRLLQASGIARSARRVLCGATGLFASAFAIVFVAEAIFVLLGPDYTTQREAGRWPDLAMLGKTWPPSSAITWGLPIAAAVIGALLLRLATPRA